MKDWIVVGVLYVLGIGIFRLFGGISAAGEALQRWGRSSSSARQAHGSSGSRSPG